MHSESGDELHGAPEGGLTPQQRAAWRHAVIYLSELSPMARHVAFAIEEYYDDKEGLTCPSQHELADGLGTHRKSISRAIRELITRGLITSERRRLGRAYRLIEQARPSTRRHLTVVGEVTTPLPPDEPGEVTTPLPPAGGVTTPLPPGGNVAVTPRPPQTPPGVTRRVTPPDTPGTPDSQRGNAVATRLAPDWAPTPTMVAGAADKHKLTPEQLEHQTELFHLHHEARGNRMLSWEKAWWGWMARVRDFERPSVASYQRGAAPRNRLPPQLRAAAEYQEG